MDGDKLIVKRGISLTVVQWCVLCSHGELRFRWQVRVGGRARSVMLLLIAFFVDFYDK